jgi:hypothetical protein
MVPVMNERSPLNISERTPVAGGQLIARPKGSP